MRLTRESGAWLPSLSGEARLVFEGRLGELGSLATGEARSR